ncbi:MAG TPA: STAS domain-containing protein [Vicinamibacterales bacterium]|nr:STAS domain-containing protein [Vicinamibacterales bacterium]
MSDIDRPIVVAVEPGGDNELEPPAFLIRGVRALLDEGYRQIFLDVARLTSIDSLLLAAIVQSYVSAVKRGGTVKLLNPPKRLRELMTVTKLDKVIEAVTTVS